MAYSDGVMSAIALGSHPAAAGRATRVLAQRDPVRRPPFGRSSV